MKLYYWKDAYVADDSIAIRAFEMDEEYGGLVPYGNVTVCLAGYGLTPPDGHIFIPTYNMSPSFYKQVVEDIVDEVVMPIEIGYGDGVLARLKPDWEKKVNMC